MCQFIFFCAASSYYTAEIYCMCIICTYLLISFASQNQTHLQLNSDVVHSIKRGVEFSRMLQLPDSVAFSSDHMGDILTAEGAVRPFKQIRLVLSVHVPVHACNFTGQTPILTERFTYIWP